MVNLTLVDGFLISAYFLALILIGLLASRRQDEEDYLIAKRKLGTWSTMATMNASKSGSILMIFVALTYIWGFSALWYFIGVITGVILFIPFAMRLKENSAQRFYTLADYFKYNYGKKVAVFASLISIFLMFGFLVLNLIAGTKIFVFFTGWAFWICAIIMVVIVMVYLLLGGFKAVVKTDILQYIAMVFILTMLTIVLFNGSLIPAADWNFLKADMLTMVGFFIIGVSFAFSSPDLWRRVYSSKGKRELKRGLILSVIVYAFMAFLLALVALTIKAQFPDIDPDLALIQGFGSLLPAGLLGLASILLFAAIMSSIDTYIFTGASAVVQDFFEWSKEKIVKNIRRVIFILAVLGLFASILIKDLIIGSYLFVAFAVVLAVPVMATWIKKEIKQKTLMFGFTFGIIGLIGYMVINLISGGGIQPMIVMAALGSSLIGLLIGAIVSKFSR